MRRLIAEAEQRKHAVRQQQHLHAAHSGVEVSSQVLASARANRAKTSEERSGGALQRKAASVLLSALSQRPPTR